MRAITDDVTTDDRPAALRGVSAGYRRHPVLHDVTAEFPAGRRTAVVGPNGSGKSTLLGVLAGVLPVLSGSVRRPGSAGPALVAQRSSVSDALPLTVRAAVEMGRWASTGPWRRLSKRDREVVADCLERLGVAELAERPLGALSGGQRQRVLVAQGLAQRAGLLLLDEPAAGLDVAAQRHITAALDQERSRGTTVVQVTHDFAEAREADHCLVLRDGRLLAAGPPGEVLTREVLSTVWAGVPAF
ncbi:zinc ABC transporter ATP-binding protein AztA [Saccharopolyspora sp. NFXS83]|uniref:zinc ABC transporter ATP-binding protein AztA n=1 Tax=Saccharopolyspora sp. NFXS83 TaxID=2993560 RepID=UPI00224B3B20|nr:zinc ABC transporter ATP-binding protein AztA [Saccharopolyspora sp. NFXS83]MCX2731866.1 zinc ABC transporter ATP-binding protein AztA [Saccharopolyspora sp. NFXS83]